MEKTANQSILPISAKINDKGNLEIGGCDVIELAQKYDTPLYVYDEATIKSICNSYKTAFEKYKNFQPMFASKAFMTKYMCKLMQKEGFGLDVVSGGELYTAIKSGFDMSKIVFNGNNKSIDELEMALDNNIGRISVDNFLELALLDNLAKSKNKNIDIFLRITPGIECHTHEYIQTGHLDSKFGFDLTQLDEAVELVKEQYTSLNIKGLHAHIGSQIFETQVYYDVVEVILKEMARIKEKHSIELQEMNIGGGLGITYTENDTPPSINEIAEVILDSLESNSKKYGINSPKLYIEPGRSIVGTAGATIYTVGSSKQVPNGKKYVALDGGMSDNPRPSMYQAIYTAVVADKVHSDDKEIVTLAGKHCESGDIIIKDIELPKLEEGDIVCVFNTGAYGYSMSSNYNRVLKPCAVTVQNGQSSVIIKRETYDELISHDVIPDYLS
ncbi:MAG: diaminopimelate decarboxylase [Candidatus Gastranaerophilales bacterium]|nr:diaminopimelate decarboxylase [Candidatus Gastranaerophilales bacterium]